MLSGYTANLGRKINTFTCYLLQLTVQAELAVVSKPQAREILDKMSLSFINAAGSFLAVNHRGYEYAEKLQHVIFPLEGCSSGRKVEVLQYNM